MFDETDLNNSGTIIKCSHLPCQYIYANISPQNEIESFIINDKYGILYNIDYPGLQIYEKEGIYNVKLIAEIDIFIDPFNKSEIDKLITMIDFYK
jgi:hypothetical protein